MDVLDGCDCGGGIAILMGIRQSLVPSREQQGLSVEILHRVEISLDDRLINFRERILFASCR